MPSTSPNLGVWQVAQPMVAMSDLPAAIKSACLGCSACFLVAAASNTRSGIESIVPTPKRAVALRCVIEVDETSIAWTSPPLAPELEPGPVVGDTLGTGGCKTLDPGPLGIGP